MNRTSYVLPPSTLVFGPGEPLDSVFRVESGLVKVTRTLDGSKPDVRLVRPGEVFDERALLQEGYVSDSFAMSVGECALKVLSAASLRKNGGIWRQIAVQAIRRAEEAELRARLMADRSAGQRMAHMLADLADQCNLDGLVPLSRTELAAIAGTARETTSTVISRLARRGLVEAGRGHVRVISPRRLRDM